MRTPAASSQRRGVVLLAVLVVVVLLTLAAYQYSELMLAEYRATDSYLRSSQARAFAASGINFAAAALSTRDNIDAVLAGNPWNNSGSFQGVIVQSNDVSRFQGRFSLVTPVDPNENSGGLTFRYGVSDESGKINLNALIKLDSSGAIARNVLILLPNMTEAIANAIIDWIDPDDEPQPEGAESDVYAGMSPPYRAKNGPLDSIDELLLVRGVTAQLLFGNDRNRNGVIDPDEDNGSGVLDRGWAAYLTVHSREPNVDLDGNQRININDTDLLGLRDKLVTALGNDDLVDFIIAWRMYGSASGGGTTGTTSGTAGAGASGTGASGSGGGSSSGGSGSMGSAGSSSSGTTRSTGSSGGSSGSGASGGSGGTSGSGQSGQGSSGATGQGGTSTQAAQANGTLQQVRQQIQTDLQAGGRQGQSISSLFQLVNGTVTVQVQVQTRGQQQPQTGGGASGQNTQQQQTQSITVASPLSDPTLLLQALPLMLDKLTTVRDTELPPRVNVNTAPQAVLAALPGLTETDVQTIMSLRPNTAAGDAPDETFDTPAWLITEANLSVDTLRGLERYITTRSQTYRVQSIGYFDGGGPSARIEAVIDANNGRPRIVYWRDLTELGRGFNVRQ